MTRFYDELVDQYRLMVAAPQRVLATNDLGQVGQMDAEDQHNIKGIFNKLVGPDTKRILFDARQAMYFDPGERLPQAMQAGLRPPFDLFWLELTEPIRVEPMQPGKPYDRLRGLVYDHNRALAHVGEHELALDNVMFVFTGESPERPKVIEYTDRSFSFHLPTGFALSRVRGAIHSGDPSEFPDEYYERETTYFVAGANLGMPDRHVGWWEQAIQAYGSLLSYCLAYMLAKSIEVIQEPVSRQVRRWHEAHGLPLPWHIVRVKPQFRRAMDTEGEGTQHGYRYDVIGHLRFGRHPRADGTYSQTIEWVKPHQRGLANELYIPATHYVKEGKIISSRMRAWYRQNDKGVKDANDLERPQVLDNGVTGGEGAV
ncbi:MAG: hypothetical protein Q8R28_15010 [Dehalococcoidia bacterium]|nr:hypothetical protein [Dehalococcoidia bacterium]